MDERLKRLSYSGLLILHSCPRKYQLDRLNSEYTKTDDIIQSLTFAFGTIVGEGVQLLFLGNTLDETIWKMFLIWELELTDLDYKRKKSFYFAVVAVQRLYALQESGTFANYELAYWNNTPCIELSYYLTLPNGFKYRGKLDLVLRHKENGEVVVLETKTTWNSQIFPATYKNSSQALGYSVALDVIFPGISAYSVYHLIYKTSAFEWEALSFNKTYHRRAGWIQELLLDVLCIQSYADTDCFPIRGESCRSFGRDCRYFSVCTLETKHLITEEPVVDEKEDEAQYQIKMTLDDILEAQKLNIQKEEEGREDG